MTVHIELIPEHKVPGKPLGRHKRFDDKSRSFKITKPPAEVNLDKDLVWTRRVNPFDQGDLGSCTIQGSTGVLSTAPFKFSTAQKKFFNNETARERLYSEETASDTFPGQWPPDDTGSTTLDAAKLLLKLGLIARYEWGFTADDSETAIFKSPFEVGVNWYEGFDNPNPDGIARVAGSVRGGHAFEILGRVHTTKYGVVWVAVQSWGKGWPTNPFMGKTARFGILDTDFHRLREEQGELMQPVPLGA